MSTNDKTDSSTPGGTGGAATTKADTTASAKLAAKKKNQQQQQKNQKGNLAGQFRVFQKKLAGAAADDKAYGLDSSILDLVAKVKSDFVKPKPNPLIHSKLMDVMEKDDKGVSTKVPTGERKLVCFDPIVKDQMEAEYSMDLKIQKSNWNQFERHYEGYYRIAIGNIEDTIITYCRADKRMALIESNKDLVGLLLVLRAVCAKIMDLSRSTRSIRI
jgi:hypothetical protein